MTISFVNKIPLFLITMSIIIFSAHASEKKITELEDLFYFDKNFPFYWNDKTIYSTFFHKEKNESSANAEIASLFESLLVSYSNQTGIRIENSTHHELGIKEINIRIRESNIALLIANDLFYKNIPNFSRINDFFDNVGIDIKIEKDGFSAYIPNDCGIVIIQDDRKKVRFSLLYVDENSSYGEKRSCIEIFSSSMVFVRPMLKELISNDEGANFLPVLLASSIGYCRESNQENFDCIREYLRDVSRKIEIWGQKKTE